MPRKQKKYHFIYKTTCLITGKFYVGMHSADNLEDGYLGSGKILGYSIGKHGRENHQRVILEFSSSREELKQREKEIVNEELLAQPLNINLKYGGEGGGFLAEANKKNSFHVLGAIAANRIRREKLAQKMLDPGFKDRWRAKISENNSKSPPFLGKSHSLKTKKQMSAAHVGKHDGSKNSQFGTVWVTHGKEAIKIKRIELEFYLSNGFSRGRKIT